MTGFTEENSAEHAGRMRSTALQLTKHAGEVKKNGMDNLLTHRACLFNKVDPRDFYHSQDGH